MERILYTGIRNYTDEEIKYTNKIIELSNNYLDEVNKICSKWFKFKIKKMPKFNPKGSRYYEIATLGTKDRDFASIRFISFALNGAFQTTLEIYCFDKLKNDDLNESKYLITKKCNKNDNDTSIYFKTSTNYNEDLNKIIKETENTIKNSLNKMKKIQEKYL